MRQAEIKEIFVKELSAKAERIVDNSYNKMFALMKKERNARIKRVYQLVQANVGDYIAFSGKAYKKDLNNLESRDFYRIVELSADGLVVETSGENRSFLPARHFNQECRVLSEEEYFEKE